MSTATLYSVPSLLKAVINGENNEAMRESAQKLLEAYQKQNEKRNSKAAEKRAAENAPFVEAVTNLLRSNSKVWTATEVKDAIEGIDSTSKATAILKMVEGIKVGEVVINKRVVKGYSL